MNIMILCIIVLVLLISILLFRLYKKKQLIKGLTQKIIFTPNYERDFAFINNVIEEKCSYAFKIELSPRLKIHKNLSTFINDKLFTEIVIRVSHSIIKNLSPSYKELLSHYTNDIEGYVIERIYEIMLYLVMGINKEIINKL